MYVANNFSILQYCHGMSIEGVLNFYRITALHCANSWEGVREGLTARQKCKSSLLRHLLLFLEVGRKRGGVTAGQYGTVVL